MPRYPHAAWKPISHNFTPGGNRADTIVFHTASDGPGTTSLRGWFDRPTTKASAHFFVDGFGRVEQYIDTADRAWSAFAANSRAIAIETHDGGHPDQPWNDAQLFALVALTAWICEVHPVPRRRCVAPSSGGLGWHEEFAEWNHNGHRCPGPAREAQVRDFIVPRVAAPSSPASPPPAPGPAPAGPSSSVPGRPGIAFGARSHARPGIAFGARSHAVAIWQFEAKLIATKPDDVYFGDEAHADGTATFGLHTAQSIVNLGAITGNGWRGDFLGPDQWRVIDLLYFAKERSYVT